MPSLKNCLIYGTIGLAGAATAALSYSEAICTGTRALSPFLAPDLDLLQFCTDYIDPFEKVSTVLTALSPILACLSLEIPSEGVKTRILKLLGVGAVSQIATSLFQRIVEGPSKNAINNIGNAFKFAAGLSAAACNSLVQTEYEKNPDIHPDND